MENILQNKSRPLAHRRLMQWLLAPVVVLTVALGWHYPMLGFVVPASMMVGMTGGMVRGRWVCGNLCPRGGFYDRLIAPLAPKRRMPPLLRNMTFRWGIFAALIGFMVWRIAANPTDIAHWGRVFWSMCAATTAVGLVTAFFFHPRSWCAFCPVGTFQNAVGGHRQPLQIDSSCRSCGTCEKACPMSLPIRTHAGAGVLRERDCLKCSECIAACGRNALAWPEVGE